MKKVLVVVLSIILVLSCVVVATACEDKESDFKVGCIYIGGKNDTAGYTYAHANGINQMKSNLKLSDDQIIIRDNVPEDTEKVGEAIDALVGSGCKIIFGISFGYIDAFEEKAEEYPDVIFSHATGYLSNETNFNNYFGRIYQARYLSGIAAGLKTETNKIGYVAAHGTAYAETCSGINAFALGVKAVNPDAVVKLKVMGEWGNETKEKQLAETLLSDGCDVIAQHCDSAQPQIAAEKAGCYGCGYNSDMTSDAPDAHLTAPIWNWSVYYTEAVEQAMKGKEVFMENMGQAWYEGLNAGFVDVSALSKNCVDGTDDAIAQVKEMMIAWEKDHSAADGFDVFSGHALNITVANGAATITKVDYDMGYLVKADLDVKAGDGYVGDEVIKSTMNQYVENVEEM